MADYATRKRVPRYFGYSELCAPENQSMQGKPCLNSPSCLNTASQRNSVLRDARGTRKDNIAGVTRSLPPVCHSKYRSSPLRATHLFPLRPVDGLYPGESRRSRAPLLGREADASADSLSGLSQRLDRPRCFPTVSRVGGLDRRLDAPKSHAHSENPVQGAVRY